MRVARLLHEDAEEASPFVLLALERDGALYDVAELERAFDTPYSPLRFPHAGDFHTRVVALGGAGLDALDERLLAGDRPSQARLWPGAFGWLAPCDPERALLVQLAPKGSPRPWYRLGNARGLLGHEAAVPFPDDESRPAFELGVAAVLGDELRGASPAEAERAILGYTLLNGWCGRDEEAREPAASRRVAAQLGPVLVTGRDAGDVLRLRAQLRVDGEVTAQATVGEGTRGAAESIAWLSGFVDLRAGDVIGLGALRAGDVAWGARVELGVERLGRLAGRAAR